MERLVLAVLLCLARTSLAQDMVPPQVFGCPGTDIAGTTLTTTSQASTAMWNTPSGFNIQPGPIFAPVFEFSNIYSQTSESTQFNYGFTTVGYRFVDNGPTSPPQNSAFCTFFVRTGVNNDGTIPTVLNCPGSITQPIASSQTTAVVSWTEPSTTDNNGVVRRSWRSHAPNTAFPVGTTQVTYQWIDPSNPNSPAQCMFTVTVSTTGTDGVVPSLTCPADVVASASGIATWTPPTPTDASGIASTTSTLTPGSVVQEGFTTVTYNTVDGSGNRASCSFIVRRAVTGAYGPVITSCPNNIQQTVTSGASGFVTWTEPTAYDDGGHVRLVMQTHSPNTAFPVGTTPVEYLFQDPTGSTARCVFTVELTVTGGGDTTLPTFTNCPTTSPVFTITSGSTTFVIWPVPQATDNQGTPTVTQILGVSPGTSLAAGQYTIRYQAQDAAGNTAFCMFTVLVQQGGGDTTLPTFTDCPTTSPTFMIPTGSTTTFVSWAVPQATDNQGTPTVTQIQGVSPGSNLAVGQYTIRYQAQDAAGNTAFCMFTVLVQQAGNTGICNPNPCRDNANCFTRTSAEGYVCECNMPNQAGYNCEVQTENQEVFTCYGSQCSSGSFISLNYPNNYPNRYRAQYLLYVPGASGFTFTFDTAFQIETDKDELYIGRGLTPPISEFNGVNTTVDGVFFFEGYNAPNPVTVTNTDTIWMYFLSDKNLPYIGFRVSWQILDTQPPVITGCPGNLVRQTFTNAPLRVTWPAITATDASAFTVSASHSSGDLFPIGTTPVTFTFVDAGGQSSICQFSVIVRLVDNDPPVISGCPDDFSRTTSNMQGLTVFWTPPTATDVSSFDTRSTHTPGQLFPVAATQVTYTFTDVNGLSSTCAFTVTVVFVDNTPPVISGCPGNLVFTTNTFGGTAFVTWTPPTATDDSPVTQTSTHNPGQQLPVGRTEVVYTFTDTNGQASMCSFIVEVVFVDIDDPFFDNCPTSFTVTAPFNAGADIEVTWTAPTAMDNAGPPTAILISHNPGDRFLVGQVTTVLYRYTDAAGNTGDCRFDVTVTRAVDNVPPVINCPANIIREVTTGTRNGVEVTWNLPIATDNTGSTPTVILTSDQQLGPGAFFQFGTYTIAYSAVDGASNSAQCSFTVTVVDRVPPVLNCPPNLVREVTSGNQNGIQVSWNVPTATDNSGAAPNVFLTSNSQQTPGSFFAFGTYTITYTASDGSGNSMSCSFTVNVVDRVPPVITCPADITQRVTTGNRNGIEVQWSPATATDNSGAEPNVFLGSNSQQGPGSFFQFGTYTITYFATDGAGNSIPCSFTVTVVDEVPPSVQCPGNVAFSIPFTANDREVDWSEPVVSDNSGTVSFVSRTHEPNSRFQPGITTVMYTYRDPSGNTESCTFTVTITRLDGVPPVINCPANVLQEVTTGNRNGIEVTWNLPTATDNSGIQPTISLTSNAQLGPGSFFPFGSYTITYRATDAEGNSESCSFIVTVVDRVPPVLNCPSNIIQEVTSGNRNGIEVSWTVPTATDNSGAAPNVFLTSNSQQTPGSFFAFGTYTITYTASDGAGNSMSCSFTLTVVDRVPPVITCPADITQRVTTGNRNGIEVQWSPATATDNSGAVPNVFLGSNSQQGPGSFFQFGTYSILYIASDGAGNSMTCSFTVTVVDGVPPSVQCPGNVAFTIPFTANDREVDWSEPVVSDNSGTVSFVSRTHEPNSRFQPGITTVMYTYRDPAGNTESCTFTVTITRLDGVPPVINCPANILQEVTTGNRNGIEVTWNLPTATDNSGIQPTISLTSNAQLGPGSFFPFGSYTITYRATDAEGNSESCSFTVTVVDRVPPVLNCPSNIIQEVTSGNRNGIEVSWTVPTATDNSGAAPNVFLTSNSQQTPGSFFAFGTYTITYTASDGAGNSMSCSFTLTVVDRVPPVITCPADITQRVTTGNRNGIEVQWSPATATDNSGAVPNVFLGSNSQQGPGSFFQFGTYSILYIASDGAGNSMTCSFTVTVVDGVPPSVQCPGNVAFTIPFTANDREVDWSEPVVSDNSGTVSFVSRTHEPNSRFQPGITTVMYTYRDPAGNTESCTFTVTITRLDGVPPVINCPANILQEVTTGNRNGIEVTWNLPTATDNSGIQPTISLTSNAQLGPGSFFPFGSYTITYRATDAEGNSESCSFTVTVVDRVPPVLNCPSNIIQEVTSGNRNGIEVSWNVPTATDNSGAAPNVFLTSNSQQTPGSFFAFGTYTITYTASDGAGNSMSCSFTLTVVDRVPPVITCPADITQRVTTGNRNGIEVQWSPATATDNSGAVPNVFLGSNSQQGPGSFFQFGTYSILYIASDGAGNSMTCSFTVTVVDGVPPSVQCPGNVAFTIPFTANDREVDWSEPVVSDNSGTVSFVSRTHEPNSRFQPGITTVMYTYRDPAGNTESCTFTVTITRLDGVPPVINCPANILQEVTTGNQNGIEVTWNLPTATDNSGIQPTISLTSNAQLGPGSFFPFGSYTITYRATDAEGNSESCSFTVTVVDRVPPVLNCPSNIIQEVTSGNQNGIQVSWNVPTATDNSGAAPNVFLTSNSQQTPGSFFAFGTYTITYTASDGAGNSMSCSFTVNVVDRVPPVITCPADITQRVTTGNRNGIEVQWSPATATDNSGAEPNVFLGSNSQQGPGSFFQFGTYSILYIASDGAGNSMTCSFTVTVVDGVPPSVQCPGNVAFTIPFTANDREVDWSEPVVSDNSGTVSFVSRTHEPNSRFQPGITTVMYTYRDPAGNTESCTFTVTITRLDGVPPVINCPANILQEVTTGNRNGIEVTWNLPTATDNSGIQPTISLTSNAQLGPGSFFPFGSYTITYRATDAEGNSESCSFTVTVVDRVPPVLNCPSNIIQEVTSGNQNGIQVSWTVPTATDNSGAAPNVFLTSNSQQTPGSFFAFGTYTITYTASDGAGNSMSCSFTVNVVDRVPPVITCPADITLRVTTGNRNGIEVQWSPATATDNSGAEPNVFLGSNSQQGPGSFFQFGTYSILYIASDGAGNSMTCSFTVTVVDEVPPSVQCPGNVAFTIPFTANDREVTWSEPVVSDNSGTVTFVSRTHEPNSRFQPGITTVMYTYRDPSGNTESCSFTVTITRLDGVPPVINCPANILQEVTTGNRNGIEVTWNLPTATDNSGIQPTITLTSNAQLGPGSFFPFGSYTITYRAADAEGNSESCSFTVTVVDRVPPVLNCPSNIIQEVSSGNQNGIQVSWTVPTATDNSGAAPNVFLTSNSQQTPGSFFAFGTYTITYTASDGAGNSMSCSFTLTVVDRVPPVITCPADITQRVTTGNRNGIEVQWSPATATDNSGAEPNVFLGSNSQQGPGSFFQFGTYSILYIASDGAGNSMTCSFTVTVVDEVPPSVQCPGNVAFTIPFTANDREVTWSEPVVSDNSGTVTFVSRTHEPNSRFQPGITTVMYTYRDPSGNTESCSFTVTITRLDGVPPVINCPANILQEVTTGNRNGIEVTWNLPTATDNSGIQPTITLTSNAQLGPGSFFPFGSYTITYRAADAEGNSESCSFTVTVVDRVPPVLNCPSNIIQEVTSGNQNGIQVSWTVPTATDNSGAAPNVFLTSNSQQTPGSFFAFGTYTITYTASDGAGNSMSCSFTVNVVDLVPPVITCPADITQRVTTGNRNGIEVQWSPATATDNSGAEPNVFLGSNSQQGPGSFFQFGTYSILYIASDGAGNSMTCSFTVTVVDEVPPSVQCPGNVAFTIPFTANDREVTWSEPVVSDNSGTVTFVSRTHEPNSRFQPGITTVMYTYRDPSGNTESCSFTVTITRLDGVPPVINCPANILQEVTTGNRNGIEVTWNLPTATDNSGIQPTITLTSNAQLGPGSFFPFGSYTITYRAADAEGNSESCSFTVTVVDRVPPVLNCPSNIIQEVTSGNQNGIQVSWTVPTATDNSGAAPNVFLTSNAQQTPGSFFAFGTYTITYTASDGAGNSMSCSFTVNVVDRVPPVITCPADITQRVTTGNQNGIEVQWSPATATDNSGAAPNVFLTSNSQQSPGSFFAFGTYTIIYTASDGTGNSIPCSFTVTVVDEVPPSVQCPGNVAFTIPFTANDRAVTWSEPVVSDNSGTVTFVSRTHEPNSRFQPGITTVMYTYRDPSGNTESCSFTVTITRLDGVPPVINCPANILQEVTTGNRNGIEVTWNLPTATDNSGIQPTITLTSNAQLGPGSFFPFGSYTITYRAADAEGNSESCSFTVTVVDRVPPVLNCPSNIIQEVTSGNQNGIQVSWTVPTATDNSGAAPNVFLTSNAQQTPGSFFAFGTYTITYTASDGAGNSMSCSFTVNVVDRVPPVITCPADITQRVTTGNQNGIEVQWSPATATDNSGAAPNVFLTSNSQQSPGSFFAFGTYTIIYTASDGTGNSIPCSFTVTVVDEVPPSVQCPGNVAFTIPFTANDRAVTWSEPVVSDNSGTVTFVSRTHEPNSRFQPGITTVMYTYRDPSGNTESCSFTVTITRLDGVPPVINCPANILQEVTTGNRNGIEVTWNLPTATDNSGIQPTISLTSNAQLGPGSFFPFGSYTITYRAADAEGNSESCSFTVTVVDRVPPVLNCPSNIIQEVTSGNQNGIQVSWTVPTATDNSGAAPNVFLTSNSQQTPGSFFAFGTYTITYTASDGAGNSMSCSFTVNVVDRVPPVITCPADITQRVTTGNQNGIEVQWSPATATDNSGAAPNVFLTSNSQQSPGSFFAFGTYTIIYTASDGTGNSIPCSFTVTVVDEVPPSVQCPGNVAFTIPFTANDRAVTWSEPVVSDNSGTVTFVSRTHEPNSRFQPGITTVMYTYRDPSGNTESCSFTVTITRLDGVPPVINCPANILQEVTTGNRNGIEVTWNLPTATDNSGIQPTISLTSNAQLGPGSFFPFGSYTITYRAADAEGNSESCSFTVTVVDRVPPVLNCPSNIIREVTSGSQNGIQVSWNVPTATDNSGAAPNVFLTSNSQQTPGSFFAFGTYTITYTASDGAGNSMSCSFTLTVVDRVPPVITCPADITQRVTTGNRNGIEVQWSPATATDNSGAAPNVFLTSNSQQTPGSFFAFGTYTITYTASDGAGNSMSCSFTVTVVDEVPPSVQCPGNVAFDIPFTANDREVTWSEPVVSDNSGTVTFVSRTHEPNSRFQPGITTVMYTYRDPSGNTESCSFTVTITRRDGVPPVINCPANILQEVTTGNRNGIEVTWNLPTATDNSGIQPTISLTSNAQFRPGSFFPFGSYTITYRATDAEGNSDSCSFTVTVVDRVPPAITCPTNIIREVTSGNRNGIEVSWTVPTATDNSGAEPTVTLSSNPQQGPGSFFQFGSYTINYRAIDGSGNNEVCSFTVTVVDRVPPVITCPADINEEVSTGNDNGANVIWSPPTATDNSGSSPTITLTSNPNQGPNAYLMFGTYTITYRATDGAGNANTCSFRVIVRDTVPPRVVCPASFTRTVSIGATGAAVTWSTPTATDNAGDATFVESTRNSGDFLPVGVTQVTYTYVDLFGNRGMCSFTVTITEVDGTTPTLLSCPSDITITILAGTAPVQVDFVAPTATDNSGNVQLVSNTFNPGDNFPVGNSVVTYRFEDAAQNFAVCTFTVTVMEANPCLSQPCMNGGVCVAESVTAYRCICTLCFSGTHCENAVDICQSNNCQNGGACTAFPGSCTQYECQCSDCFIGRFCETIVDSCENNQCANGASCSPRVNNCLEYTCHCPACYTGQFCRIPVSPCTTNNCQNGGICQALTSSSPFACHEYTCACSGCFTGQWCQETRDACNPNPCLNGAVCTTQSNDCYAYSCQCQGCFTGYNCERTIESPCQLNPCQNGGTCNTVVGACRSYTCLCPLTHTGSECELVVTVNPNPCNSFPCLNGATCLTMDGTHYICVCLNGFLGENCQSTTTTLPQLDGCGTSQCSNGGMCYNSYNSNSRGQFRVQYTCICASGFSGSNCNFQISTNPNFNICALPTRPPCEAGAPCSNAFHSFDGDVDYFCSCPDGYIGHNCETRYGNPCLSAPCRNGGTCTSFNTYFTCQCASGFAGTICEILVGDNTPPVITGCPSSLTRNLPTGSATVVSWTAPQATDNSGTANLIYSTHPNPSGTFRVGVTVVSYVFTDPSGNDATCTFFVTITSGVTDNIPPTITNCPIQGVRATLPTGATRVQVSWTVPSATDNSGQQVTSTSNYNPMSTFPLGNTRVTYTFTDASRNSATCTFDVIVTVAQGDTIPPVISGCPVQGVTVTAPAGATSAVVTWTQPTAVDNSGGVVTRLTNRSPGQTFSVGTTAVTYIFTDPSGNSDTCNFNVIVLSGGADNTPPIVSGCPVQGVTAMAPTSATSAVVNWPEPTAVDNSGGVVTRTSTRSPGQSFAIGVTNVVYTFTDPSQNVATCSFTVTVTRTIDNTIPVISGCPTDRTVNLPSGSPSVTVSWTEPTATDNSGAEPTRTGSHTPGQSFTSGVTNVGYTFTDPSGNQAFCNFIVTVVGGTGDTTAPVISGCPSGVSISVPTGVTSATVSWTEPTATDNSGAEPTRTSSHSPGQSFNVGTTNVIYTFRDPSQNMATCSFIVTVQVGGVDMTAPVISGCPADITVNPDAGQTFATVTWTPPTATDNSGAQPNVASTHNPGQRFNANTVSRVTYTFWDARVNIATCQFSITVTDGSGGDMTAPTVSGCPSGVSVTAPSGATTATASWTEPTATDDSGAVPTRTSSHSPGQSFPLGQTMVEYTFRDPSGNQAMCVFVVNVQGGTGDTTAPVISGCPSGVSISVPTGVTSATVSWTEPTATDNSGAEPTRTSSHSPGQSFNVGMTNVIYTFRDPSQNMATCSFIVTVQVGGVDMTPPVISGCPADITVNPDAGQTFATVTWTPPTATDNSGAQPNVASTHNPGQRFNANTVSRVTYTFWDARVNIATCQFSITVTDGSGGDMTAPTVSGCPSGVSVTAPSGATTATASWTEPTATDDSGAVPTRTSSHSPGQSFPLGQTMVEYTFRDPSGNQAMCVFVVNVQVGGVDMTPPVISGCPADITVNPDAGQTFATVTWTPPTATDNSGAQPNVASTHNPGQRFNANTVSQVTYTFWDARVNIATCQFSITVTDGSGGDMTAPTVSGCPSGVSVTAPSGATTATASWTEPTATDDSGAVPTRTSSHSPGQSFPIGQTMVEYTFRDPSGNQAMCVFVVNVQGGTGDTTAPVISGCPSGVSISVPTGVTSATVSWTEPTATDNSGAEPTRTSSHSPGQSFNVGTTNVIYTFRDPSQNMATCSFIVTVQVGGVDMTPPVISGCPADITVNPDAGQTFATVTWTPPTATDNSGAQPNVASTHNPGQRFNANTVSRVTYTFWDARVNIATCQFSITVTDGSGGDMTAPTVSGCPSGVSVTAPSGATTATASWTEPTATDDSGAVPTRTSSHSPGQSFPIGQTMVQYTFRDPTGNQAMCVFVVNVQGSGTDTTAPVVSGCPTADVTARSPIGASTIIVRWTEPSATDDSGGQVSVTASHSPGQSFPVGMTNVVYTFRDPTGNSAGCAFVVNVIADTRVPVITGCPTAASGVAPSGSTTGTATWNEPTAADDDNLPVRVARSHTPGSSFQIGGTTVRYIFMDSAGNQAICSFVVTITSSGGGDTTPPTIVCPASITGYVREITQVLSFTWSNPTVSDDSGVQPTVTTSPNYPQPTGTFDFGTYQITYTAEDGAGNMASCTLTINVILDTQPPTFTGCPAQRQSLLPSGSDSVIVTWTEPVGSDNIGITNTERSHRPGDSFGLGITQVTYTFSDRAGNQASCIFSVNVTARTSNPCESNPCSGSTPRCFYTSDEYLCLPPVRKRRDSGDVANGPCEHGGLAVEVSTDPPSFYCACPNGYTGILCQIREVSICEPNPCANNGTCYPTPSSEIGYECECQPGWVGQDCTGRSRDNIRDLQDRSPIHSTMTWIMVSVAGVLATFAIILAAMFCRLAPRLTNPKLRYDEVPIVH
ncbi:uncharacterized protein LOC119738747 isoform X6 [Patiria miniata]|uniref:Hyalin n=1 Tax=Patiria miniata TaxID=46514 RepID=A0A914B130_PATMI|nr:uncharacterized protein LOC119738747 isoform X6 [Patiria miniata]